MEAWMITAVVAGAFVTLGKFVDHLLVKQQKVAWHEKMTQWWVNIYETQFPDIDKLMAIYTLKALKRIFRWKLFSWKTISLSFMLSFFATTIAVQLGQYVSNNFIIWYYMPTAGAYLGNYLFDLVTVLITVKILRLIRQSNLIRSVFLIFIDVVLACSIAFLSWVGMAFGSNLSDKYINPLLATSSTYTILIQPANKQRDEKVKRNVFMRNKEILQKHGISYNAEFKTLEEIPDYSAMLSGAPLAFFKKTKGEKSAAFDCKYRVLVKDGSKEIELILSGKAVLNWPGFFSSCTTVVPTAVYMVLLTLMLLSKVFLEGSKKISMHLLERITQDDPNYELDKFKPGTLFGYLFGAIATLSNSIASIIKLLS